MLFRILTGIAAVYHLLLAIAGLLFPPATLARVIELVMGVAPALDGDMLLAIKFASAYVLAFGIGLALLSWKPVHYRPLLPCVLVLFGVRLINRIVVFSTLAEQYEVSFARNAFGVVALLVLFTGILLTSGKKARA